MENVDWLQRGVKAFWRDWLGRSLRVPVRKKESKPRELESAGKTGPSRKEGYRGGKQEGSEPAPQSRVLP
jgi:hypothetical protein